MKIIVRTNRLGRDAEWWMYPGSSSGDIHRWWADRCRSRYVLLWKLSFEVGVEFERRWWEMPFSSSKWTQILFFPFLLSARLSISLLNPIERLFDQNGPRRRRRRKRVRLSVFHRTLFAEKSFSCSFLGNSIVPHPECSFPHDFLHWIVPISVWCGITSMKPFSSQPLA